MRKLARYICYIDIGVFVALGVVTFVTRGRLLRGNLWSHELYLLGGIWVASYLAGLYLDIKAIRATRQDQSKITSSRINSDDDRRLVLALGVLSAGVFFLAMSLAVISLQRFEITVISLFVVGSLLLVYVRVIQQRRDPRK